MKKMIFSRNNDLRTTTLILNVETILEKNVQSEISLPRVIDENTCVLEN